MGLSIIEIRDKTVRARHLMQHGRNQRFAVGAFNIDNQETLEAICRAAQKAKRTGASRGQRGRVRLPRRHGKPARHGGDNFIEKFGVEMYINLDHAPGRELQACH